MVWVGVGVGVGVVGGGVRVQRDCGGSFLYVFDVKHGTLIQAPFLTLPLGTALPQTIKFITMSLHVTTFYHANYFDNSRACCCTGLLCSCKGMFTRLCMVQSSFCSPHSSLDHKVIFIPGVCNKFSFQPWVSDPLRLRKCCYADPHTDPPCI